MTTEDNTHKKINKLIGIRMRACRLENGLTQDDLGKKMGVTYQQIQKYEAGINNVSAARLWQIAKILNKPIADFFDNNDELINITSSDCKFAISLHRALLNITPVQRKIFLDLIRTVGGNHDIAN